MLFYKRTKVMGKAKLVHSLIFFLYKHKFLIRREHHLVVFNLKVGEISL
jgi:hypothetical protein